MPEVQFSRELVGELYSSPGVSRVAFPSRQLNRPRAEHHDVIFARHPLLTQTEPPVPVQFLA